MSGKVPTIIGYLSIIISPLCLHNITRYYEGFFCPLQVIWFDLVVGGVWLPA